MATQNTTQFMTSVMEKLRNANAISQSNNLESLAAKGKTANAVSQSVQEEDIIQAGKTAKGKAGNSNAYKEDFVNGFGINNGQGLIQDQQTREIVSGILTPLGTVADIVEEVGYGVLKVGEGIVDAFVALFGWIGTWFGASDQWAKDFIAVDASRYAIEGIDFVAGGWISQLALGETMAEQSAFNYIDDQEVQANIRGIGNVVGEIIPSLVLAYFTGGSSLALQIGSQAALAGVSTLGESSESAIQENGDVGIGEALGYGAIRGGIAAVTAGISMGTGSALAAKGSQGIAGKIGDAIIDKGGNMIAVFAAQAGYKATTAAGRAAMMTAVDPLIKQITVDGDAIEKAYGNDEAVKRTLENIGKNALIAGVVSLGMSTAKNVIDVKKAGGLEKYTQNYIDEMVVRKANLTKEMNQVQGYISEVEKIDADLKNGLITKDQWIQQIEALNEQVAPAMSKINELAQSEGIKDYQNAKYSKQVDIAKQKALDSINKVNDRTAIPKFIEVARNAGVEDTEIFNKLVSEGMVKGNIEVDSKGNTTYSSPKGDIKLQLEYRAKDGSIHANTTQQATQLIGAISEANVVNDSIKTIQLGNRFTIGQGISDKPIQVDVQAVQQLDTKVETPKDIVSAVKTLKNNVVGCIKISDNNYLITTKDYDGDGNAVFNNFTYLPNENKITSIAMGVDKSEAVSEISFQPKGTPAHIVEGAADMLQTTKNSLKSTTDLVKDYKNTLNTYLKESLGEEKFTLNLQGAEKTGRYLFEKINDPKTSKTVVKELVDYLTDVEIKTDKGTLTLEDFVDDMDGFRKELSKNFTEALKETSKETKIVKINKVISDLKTKVNKLVVKNRETLKAGGRMRVFTTKRNDIRTKTRMDLSYDEDTKKYNTLSMMIKPITNIHSRGDVMSTQGFWENIEEFKENYTPKNFSPENNPRIPYSEDFRNEMELLEKLMPKQNADGTYPAVNSTAYNQMNRVLNFAMKLNEDAKDYDVNINPRGRAIIRSSEKHIESTKDSGISKIMNKINDFVSTEIENEYTYLKQAFRQNPIINDMVTKSLESVLVASDRASDHILEINDYKKTHKLNKVISNKKFQITKDIKMNCDQMAYAYYLMIHPEEMEELSRVNKYFIGTHNILEDMSLDDFKKYIMDNTPDNVKDYAEFIDKKLNTVHKKDYNEFYIKKNDIDSNSRKNYAITQRKGELERSKEQGGVKTVTFGNEKTRVKNNNGFVGLSLEDSYVEYVKNLYNQMEALPTYQESIRTLSVKMNDGHGGTTTPKLYLSDKYGAKAYNRLTKFLEDCAGIKDKNSESLPFIDRLLNPIANLKIITTLGTPTTMMKQIGSAPTSNVRVRYLAKGFSSKVNQNARVSSHEMEWATKNLPGYKYRKFTNDAIRGSLAGDPKFNQYVKFVDKYFMAGTRATDFFTVDGLVRSLFYQVEDQFDLKIGTEANREKVRELWIDTWMKQIGNTPGHRSLLSRSHGWTRLFFGNYQGAISAYFSGVKDKIYTYIACKKMTKEQVESNLENTKKISEEYERKMLDSQKVLEDKNKALTEIEDKIFIAKEEGADKDYINGLKEQQEKAEHEQKKAQKDYEYDRNAYQEKRADYEEAKSTKKTWDRYTSYGGKKGLVPSLVVSSLVMALYLSFVDQIKRWVIGQDDITKFQPTEFMIDVLLNSTVNQIPVINTLYGYFFKDYDLNNPGMSVFTDILEFGKTIQSAITSGKWEDVIRDGCWLVAGTSGIPIKSVYNIVYGITKRFSPETAIRMRDVMYSVSTTGNMKSLNEAIENGNDKEGIAYTKVVLEEKVGATTDNVTQEIYRLYKDGSITLPKATMESYTNENGETITLTDLQKTTFRNTYSKANNLVDKVIKNSFYKGLNDQEKSKSISYIYNAYYELAKSKVISVYTPSTKFGYVTSATGGKIDVSTTSIALSHISNIEDTKTKTRKEQVIKYVNSLKCEKGLKCLILKLAGFGLDEKSQSSLKSYLIKNGMSSKEAKAFVK